MRDEDRRYLCTQCHWNHVEYKRWTLGRFTCLACGEDNAKRVKHTIAPLHKSNYMLFVDPADLRGVNSKGGIVK